MDSSRSLRSTIDRLDPHPGVTIFGREMSGNNFSGYLPFEDRLGSMFRRGMRIASRLAMAFGLSAITAIVVGGLVTDNAFVQILVTAFAALAFWIPIFMVIVGVERLFSRRSAPRTVTVPATSVRSDDGSWKRLARAAPSHAHRIQVLQRSFDRSRLALGKADLDPDAHDLCVLIDRRLPELIDRGLDDLPPDDRDRGRKLDELVDLVEQFARHCSRKGAGEDDLPRYDAEVLRRRFEDRLSDRPF